MPKITNRSKQLLIVPLNSGGTVHLAPGETSRDLPDLELADNPAVVKMTDRGLLKQAAPAAPSPAEAEPVEPRTPGDAS